MEDDLPRRFLCIDIPRDTLVGLEQRNVAHASTSLSELEVSEANQYSTMLIALSSGSEIDTVKKIRHVGHHGSVVGLVEKNCDHTHANFLAAGGDRLLPLRSSILLIECVLEAVDRRIRRHTVDHDLVRTFMRNTISLRKETLTCMKNGDLVHLTESEFRVLWFLARRPGIFRSRESTLEVLGMSRHTFEHSLPSHLERIRRKLGSECIITKHGYGLAVAE